MELRVRLTTLLGRDQYPAELAGWGPLHAELARDLATTLGGAQWRFAITDDDGHLISWGITRARPIATATRSAACRATVELQVSATALRDLAAEPTTPTGGADLITDLCRQLDHDIPGHSRYCADAGRRTPGAALRRYLQIRDRSCIMIGCRAPAQTADQDHILDHAKGGATAAPNLGSACRHDHRLKGEGGWALHQPQPGVFRWTSRLGHTYQHWPLVIVGPLPDPVPRDRAPYPLTITSDEGWEDTEIWGDLPPEADPESDPPPEPDPDTDIPPF
ncbi:MAG: HNH endonuclease [Pseudonocardiales bacterium]|nr:HNH endonuclease [Pseudonocardiales bacterium]